MAATIKRLMTGKTFEEFGTQLQVDEYLQSLGEESSHNNKHCYLCKRGEGEKTLSFDPEDIDSVFTPPIQLYGKEIVAGDFVMVYLLCQECLVFLEGFKEGEYKSQS